MSTTGSKVETIIMEMTQQKLLLWGEGREKEVLLGQWDVTYENMKQLSHGSDSLILRKIKLDQYLGSYRIILVASGKKLTNYLKQKKKCIRAYN